MTGSYDLATWLKKIFFLSLFFQFWEKMLFLKFVITYLEYFSGYLCFFRFWFIIVLNIRVGHSLTWIYNMLFVQSLVKMFQLICISLKYIGRPWFWVFNFFFLANLLLLSQFFSCINNLFYTLVSFNAFYYVEFWIFRLLTSFGINDIFEAMSSDHFRLDFRFDGIDGKKRGDP